MTRQTSKMMRNGESMASLLFLLLSKIVPAYNQLDSTSHFQEAGKKIMVYNDILVTGLCSVNAKVVLARWALSYSYWCFPVF